MKASHDCFVVTIVLVCLAGCGGGGGGGSSTQATTGKEPTSAGDFVSATPILTDTGATSGSSGGTGTGGGTDTGSTNTGGGGTGGSNTGGTNPTDPQESCCCCCDSRYGITTDKNNVKYTFITSELLNVQPGTPVILLRIHALPDDGKALGYTLSALGQEVAVCENPPQIP